MNNNNKKRITSKVFPTLILPLISLLLAACSDKLGMEIPTNTTAAFYVKSTTTGRVSVGVETRAVSETEIADIALLLFQIAAGDTLLVQWIDPTAITLQPDGKTKVMINIPQYPSDDSYVMVVANVRARIVAAGWGTTTSLTEVRSTLLTHPLTVQNDLITRMPTASSFASDMIKVEKGKSHEFGQSGDVALVRSTAKITITKALPADPLFSLDSITVANAPLQGFVFPEGAHQSGAPSILKKNYGHLDGNGTYAFEAMRVSADSSLYLYESVNEVYNPADGSYTGPSLILKAAFKGEMGYYRLLMTDNNGTPLDIKRNKHYEVIIRNIDAYGHHSATEALNHPPANIAYRVEVTDDSSHDIVSNSGYYLGLSNSDYIYYGDLPTGNIVIAHLVHNAQPTTPTGSATVQPGDSTGNVPMTIVYNPFRATPYTGTPTDTIPLTVSLPTGFKDGKVLLRIGTLEKEITVIRRPTLDNRSEGVNNHFASSDYVYAEKINSPHNNTQTWMGFSPLSTFDLANSTPTLESRNGSIYIHYQSNNPSPLPHRVEIYITRRNNAGRIKVSLGGE